MTIFKKNPRTVAQITQNLNTIVSELEQSQNQYSDIISENEQIIESKQAQNAEINNELERNSRVAAKLKDLLN